MPVVTSKDRWLCLCSSHSQPFLLKSLNALFTSQAIKAASRQAIPGRGFDTAWVNVKPTAQSAVVRHAIPSTWWPTQPWLLVPFPAHFPTFRHLSKKVNHNTMKRQKKLLVVSVKVEFQESPMSTKEEKSPLIAQKVKINPNSAWRCSHQRAAIFYDSINHFSFRPRMLFPRQQKKKKTTQNARVLKFSSS